MTPSQQRILTLGLVTLGVLIVGFFGLRTFHAFREVRGHRPPGPPFGDKRAATDVELIRDWMTIGSLSHMYNMPPRLLYDALGIPPNGNEKKSLKQLNDKYFPDQPGYVLKTVKAEIQANLPSTAIPAETAIAVSTSTP